MSSEVSTSARFRLTNCAIFSVSYQLLNPSTGFVAEVSLLSVEGLALHRSGGRVSTLDRLNTARCRQKLLELKMATLFLGRLGEGLMITF